MNKFKLLKIIQLLLPILFIPTFFLPLIHIEGYGNLNGGNTFDLYYFNNNGMVIGTVLFTIAIILSFILELFNNNIKLIIIKIVLYLYIILSISLSMTSFMIYDFSPIRESILLVDGIIYFSYGYYVMLILCVIGIIINSYYLIKALKK